MKAVVGLRNPGSDYAGTRHNVGWEVVAEVGRRHQVSFKRGPGRARSEFSTLRIGSDQVLLAAPLTYMNQSGAPVEAVISYYKIELSDLLVVHDDIDLEFGRLRIQNGGGTGGHNGLRSIEAGLGTRDFARLKIGAGRPPVGVDPADYVLSRFSKTEREEVDRLVVDAADVVESWPADPARAQERAAHRRPG